MQETIECVLELGLRQAVDRCETCLYVDDAGSDVDGWTFR
jgi:hypothetical protein